VVIAARGPSYVGGAVTAELAEEQASAEQIPPAALSCSASHRSAGAVPPSQRDFQEALQSFWFVHLAMHIEQYGWSISAGRFDRYIYPTTNATSRRGPTKRADVGVAAQSVVKFMENVGSQVKVTVFQNSPWEGRTRKGRDCSNELSHLCLDATVALKFNQRRCQCVGTEHRSRLLGPCTPRGGTGPGTSCPL